MNGQSFLYPLYGLLVLLLCWAVFTDLRERIIANWLNLAIAGLAPVMWWASGLAVWPQMAQQIGLGVAVFALFAVFFALGGMGGGDVKLLGALGLWFPLLTLVNFLLVMSILGGLLTLIVWVRHKWTKAEGAVEVPYGVAISIAGLWSIYERYLNHFA
jgi:prepilin peptidase CpaA